MIYITGDTHGNFSRFRKKGLFRKRFRPGENGEDYVIVCGDFGLLWTKDAELESNLDMMSRYPFTLLWVQGNHENYDMIEEYPTEIWHGGVVRHIVRDKVILLERGQVFNLEGKTFFTFGGAASHDVQGGILDKDSPTYNSDRIFAIRAGLPYRVKHFSWWEQKLPTQEELETARENLSKVNYQVDYVISHCCSTSLMKEIRAQYGLHKSYKRDILTDFFDELEEKLSFQAWFFGHMHDNLRVDKKHYMLYEQIQVIDASLKGSVPKRF